MADEDNQGSSRRTLLLIIGGVFGGVVLVGLGLGVGYMIFGGTPSNPSAEVEQIIERNNPQAQPAEEPETEEELGAEGEEGEEGVGPKKNASSVAGRTSVFDNILRVSGQSDDKFARVTQIYPAWYRRFHPIR